MTALRSHSHLKELEDEGIYIMRVSRCNLSAQYCFSQVERFHRNVSSRFEAFHPGKVPFPLMHVDTGHNFPEAIAFRDNLVEKYGVELIVGSVQDSIDEGRVRKKQGRCQ